MFLVKAFTGRFSFLGEGILPLFFLEYIIQETLWQIFGAPGGI
jgi:hypothetical protein